MASSASASSISAAFTCFSDHSLASSPWFGHPLSFHRLPALAATPQKCLQGKSLRSRKCCRAVAAEPKRSLSIQECEEKVVSGNPPSAPPPPPRGEAPPGTPIITPLVIKLLLPEKHIFNL